ncbi:hypothetical protein CAPTEDRAFT_62237, partial [Capitella teleta]
MDVDEALSRLGRFGRWQVVTYCLVCCSVTISGCWHMLAIVFIGGEPDHHCALEEGQWKNETIPLEKQKNGDYAYSKCWKYSNFSLGNETIKCDQGWYYAPEYKETIITEWNLVCDKNYLMETSQSVFSVGVMCGAVVFTALADRFGRKKVHLGCQYSMLVIGLIIAFAPNYITFVILRFLQGAVREGAGLVGIVMACELFPASQRTFAGTALELFWAGAYMALALMAYLITHWRHLQLVITLIPIWTYYYRFLPESIPWLVANGRSDEAEKILQNAAKFNGISMPDRILHPHENGQVPNDPGSEVDDSSETSKMLEATGKARAFEILFFVHFVIFVVFCRFASGLIYFGLSLNTSQLVGNKYVNFFLSGFVEAPAYTLTVFVLQRFGRRYPLFIFHLIASVVLMAVVWIPEQTVPLIVTLTMVGKFAMTAAFGTVVLYAPELYPTNLRNLGFGMASVWGRIGGTIAPFSSFIKVAWAPSVAFSICALVTGVLALLLPETLNRPLPETIEEIESW